MERLIERISRTHYLATLNCKVCSQWVPQKLTEENKQKCHEHDDFLFNILMDTKFGYIIMTQKKNHGIPCFPYNQENHTKPYFDSPISKKFKTNPLQKNFFWQCPGVLNACRFYLKAGLIVNSVWQIKRDIKMYWKTDVTFEN